MADIIAFRPRTRARATPVRATAGVAALIAGFASSRRGRDDVFWLKENAELLNVLESSGQGHAPDFAKVLHPYEEMFAALPARLAFFPQYYRFLLSIALDLEGLGLSGDVAGPMAARVVRDGLVQAELSDLQRAEARRLLARRGQSDRMCDPGLDDRLRDFASCSPTFALPNRKAAYELTHILFYLSDYGRRDPGIGPEVAQSLHFAGLVALLEHNTDLLAEICIALRFAGLAPPAPWEAWIQGRLRAVQIHSGSAVPGADDYHAWMMAEWMQALAGGPLFAGQYGPGACSFYMPPPDGPLRAMSLRLMAMDGGRSDDWERMRARMMGGLAAQGVATVTLAEASDEFEAFFSRFARA